jgi:hypothetical protein
MGKDVRYRRIYDDASSEDGRRIVVDRIWPRGIRKEGAQLDEIERRDGAAHRGSHQVSTSVAGACRPRR